MEKPYSNKPRKIALKPKHRVP